MLLQCQRVMADKRLKSQRIINLMLEAKRENQNISDLELYYLAMGFKAGQR